MIKQGSWVQIKRTILEAKERTANIPNDTKTVPLIMWIKGYLMEDGTIGDNVEIKTVTGRIEQGILIAVNPTFYHNYGEFIPELLKIRTQVKEMIGSNNE